ncbi:Armadillo/beta-catenin-like repeat protein [Stieleria neptunia]|uniref:Armadillo/beta-catenin-like repeat protein n=1 Tax=Stieleria neptunia TaxID=2527979 RepID=A0A518HS75_9BACT|nr:HEAT repeat domain-containing protein [Stieleria neptunia]QDV43661.1 Armadillo/beta-catenin-like repeat protein [Stieleria neptunia]
MLSVWIAVALASLPVCGIPAGAADPVPSILNVDDVMGTDPAFSYRETQLKVSNDAIPLWLDALARPNAQLQRVTIDTIAIAHRRGMEGIDAALPALVELAGTSEVDASVRRAAVRALIELDARDQAPLLARLAQKYGAAISSLVEPALVKWKSPEMSQQWLARLSETGARRQSLVIAIQGVGALELHDGSKPLRRYVRDDSLPGGIRLAAARSLGQLSASGLQPLAAELIGGAEGDGDIVADVLAIALLSRHTDPAAIKLLRSLMSRSSTVVQSEALRRLYEIDFKIVLEFTDQAIASPDVNVRRTIASALIDSKQAARIAPLATLLDDVNPGLRQQVAVALFQLAQLPSLRDEVLSQVSGILDQDSWRGCEQATRVLVSLDHKPAGDRLVDLLRHPRGEVMVTAGWGLRRFGQRQHLPAMLGRATEIHDQFQKRKLNAGSPGVVDLMSQLFQAFGQMHYREADALVRAYVPRNFSLGERARTAAAWSVGFLYPDEAPDDLVDMLLARLNDVESLEPEYGTVRAMCAQSLGRMKAKAALPDLRRFATKFGSEVSFSCHWAIEQLTGESSPPTVSPIITDYEDWFLKPLSDDQ